MSAPAPLNMLNDAEVRLVERRHPLRFVWHVDAEDRFWIEAGEFTALAGAPTVAMLGGRWNDLAQALALDPEGRVTRALASRDTWSGIGIDWPAEAATERLPVVLSGLPVLGRDRSFGGYRGFGVCRDVAQIAAVIAARRAAEESTTPAQVSPTSAAGAQPAADDAILQTAAGAEAAPPHAAEFPTNAPDSNEAPALVSAEPRPRFTIVPAARNVVPLRASMPADKRPLLSTVERSAFQEIARALGARLEGDEPVPPSPPPRQEPAPAEEAAPPPDSTAADAAQDLAAALRAQIAADEQASAGPDQQTSAQCDTIPTTQDVDPAAPHGAAGSQQPAAPAATEAAPLSDALPALQPASPSPPVAGVPGPERAVLDRLPVGVIVYRGDAVILANRALLEWTGFTSLDALSAAGGLRALFPASAPTQTSETATPRALSIRTATGDALNVDTRLFTLGLENGTALMLMFTRAAGLSPKEAEDQHRRTGPDANKASSAADFLTRISHEVRTPLTAISGFSEMMIGQRFGPIENGRYRAYLKDIHTSSQQVLSLLNDVLDLSLIGAGKLDLAPTAVDLNEVVQQCVAVMQQEASRGRVIVRTALAGTLPPVLADAPSVQRIVHNLLSNAIKFTRAGGQVILSTTLTDPGEATMRVRDTGVGISEQDLATVLEPFRAVSPSSGFGPGLALPLSKALAEANGAAFHIRSAPDEGTLVEITFPATLVLAK